MHFLQRFKGNRSSIEKKVKYYNLDVIASVIAFYAPTENEILRLTAQNDITTQSLTGEGVGFHETIGYSTPS